MSKNEVKIIPEELKISKDKLLISREVLTKIAPAIDKNNPKHELNYLYVDDTHCVATNTRILTAFKHKEKIEGCFFVHRELIEQALKIRKAKEFIISHNQIECIKEKELNNILSLESFELNSFPEYERILDSKTSKELPFYRKENISGLLLREDVVLNPMFIPNFKEGVIHIENGKSPIVIEDGDCDIKSVVMPIVDVFTHYRE